MSRSVYLRNALLDARANNTSFAVAQLYMSLHTADPGVTGASEASGGSYARQSASFGAAAAGVVASDAEITFATLAAGTYTHFGLWDHLTAGNFIEGGALDPSKTLDAGDDIVFAIGTVTLTEAA